MGMSRHDAYYEPQDDYDNSEEFEYEVSELMANDGVNSPNNYINFAEAIYEASKADAEAVEDILCQNPINYEALGRKLYTMAFDYMEKRSINQVQNGI